MAKGFSNYRKQVLGGAGGGMPNMQQLMEQAQKMQEDLETAKEEISNAQFTGTSGGGLVKITLSGDKKMNNISISPDACDADDVEMLEDLIMAAYNDALSQAEAFAAEKMPNGTNGLF